ncbi:MAG: phage holin family protein [Pseudomonadota bacterium]|jgi:hypothetical protein
MNTSPLQLSNILQALTNIDISQLAMQTVAMALTALFIPNLRITSIFGPLLAVAALSLINTTVWNANLFSALPNSLSTQALTLLVANSLIFWGVVKILPGIESKGILPVLVAPIVFTVCSMAVPQIAKQIDWSSVRDQGTKIVSETKRYVEKVDNK